MATSNEQQHDEEQTSYHVKFNDDRRTNSILQDDISTESKQGLKEFYLI
jgi:hypothetical protein